MKDFYTALQHCLDAIDLGIDLESCLALYPEYQDQLRHFFYKWNGARDGINGLSEWALEQMLFDQALDECIKAVGRGESPENCYERYPSYARRLRPWLMAVAELPKLRRDGRLQIELTYDDLFVPEVPFTQALEEYIQAVRRKEPSSILARYPYYADKLRFWTDKIPHHSQPVLPSPEPVSGKRISMRMGNLFSPFSMQVPMAILLAMLVFLFSGLGLARAAAATVPGEVLYPLKLVVEEIHLGITPDSEKQDLKAQFAAERRKETSTLIDANIKQNVAFDGEVTSIDDSKVMVSNVVILLSDFKGNKPVVNKGEIVHIEGYTGQKGVVVKRLDVHSSNGSNKTFVAPQPLPTAVLSGLPISTPLAVYSSPPPTLSLGAVVTLPTSPSSGKGTSSNSGTSPTSAPNIIPTSQPTTAPTQVPTLAPTSAPTAMPTLIPVSTPRPTAAPTDVPTVEPPAPTNAPTSEPPTSEPPTSEPPTSEPPTSAPPAVVPTDNPNPTAAAPAIPTDNPTPASAAGQP